MNPQASPPVSYNSSVGGKRSAVVTLVLSLLLVGALVFGGWAFSQMQSYKNNSDQKSDAAVAAAEKTQAAKLQADFDQQSKSPNKQFLGSATYGSISFNYPKSWSGYVDTSGSTEPINAYFAPDVVPTLTGKTAFALRVELVATDYASVIQTLSQQNSNTGTTTAQAFLPPNLKGAANVQPGTIFTGPLNSQDPTQNVTLLAIKVRDKTLEISTQSNVYLGDFNNTVLASLKFAP